MEEVDRSSWDTSPWGSSYESDVSEEAPTFGQTLDEDLAVS